MFTNVILNDHTSESVPARMYWSKSGATDVATVLHLGGGATNGLAENDRVVAEAFAEAGATVFSCDYSAGHIGAFPEAVDLTFAAIKQLDRWRSTAGAPRIPVIVAGEERGGNLAAGLTLRIRDQNPAVLDGQVLLSPLLDPCMATASMRECADQAARQTWANGWADYLGGGDVAHPYAVPANSTRFSRVVPTLIVTSQDDPLRDETLSYADRLTKAGVSVSRHILLSGAGWPSVYRGGSNGAEAWRGTIARLFGSFVQELALNSK